MHSYIASFPLTSPISLLHFCQSIPTPLLFLSISSLLLVASSLSHKPFPFSPQVSLDYFIQGFCLSAICLRPSAFYGAAAARTSPLRCAATGAVGVYVRACV
eukprot:6186234-Pleurochrysis_carterae.AAC.2